MDTLVLIKPLGYFGGGVFCLFCSRHFVVDRVFPLLLLEAFVQENVFAFVSLPSTWNSQLPS